MEKEKRKVNLVGHNTLTVSLPTKFVKLNNIEKGDELYSSFDKNELTFSLNEKKSTIKEICLNIDNFSYYSLSRYLFVLYINNYNRIILTYSKTEIENYKNNSKSNINIIIRKILNRFIGAEIISQTSNKTEIECFLHDDEQKLEKIEKRIFFLIKETISELLINIENKTFSNFNENVYEYHDNITKFINYYLRMLDSSNKSESEKKIAYTFYETIDIIIDKIRHISEKINKHGSSKNINIYIEKMFNLLFDMFTSLHKEKLSKELISKRYELVKKFENEKFESKDIYILSDIKIIFDIINKFSQYIIIKNLEK